MGPQGSLLLVAALPWTPVDPQEQRSCKMAVVLLLFLLLLLVLLQQQQQQLLPCPW